MISCVMLGEYVLSVKVNIGSVLLRVGYNSPMVGVLEAMENK